MKIEELKSPSINFTDDQWRAAISRLAKTLLLKLPDDTRALVGDVGECLREPSVIAFASASVDLSTASAKGFPFWAVEPLLQQTFPLLDRALKTDQKHFELTAQQFSARMELCQFFALDLIHRTEIDAGIYELAGLDAKADFATISNQSASKADLDPQYAIIRNLMSPQTFEDLKRIAVTLAINNADLSPKSFEGGTAFRVGAAPGGSKRDYIGGSASDQVSETFPVQQAQRKIEERQYQLAMANAGAKLDSAHKKAAYYEKDGDFKRARREVAYGISQAKFVAMSTPDGPLDYAGQLVNLESRQKSDVFSAYSRLLAIDLGLKTIYGITVKDFPPNTRFSLQSSVTWLRSANDAISKSALSDLAYVIRISLLAELGDNFLKQIEQGWRFTLTTARFPKQCLIRLRGLAVYAEDAKGEAFYDVDVTLPQESARVSYPGGDARDHLDQYSPPPCWFRGAGSRRLAHRPEINASQALFNCSPIGTWTINLVGESIKAGKANALRDLQLDLYVVAQHQTV
jgi:hypothetical protein